MKLLTLEASSVSASVCITEDDTLLAQSFQNCGLTHSTTLLPMADHVLRASQLALDDIDAVAVTVGPGSFTGIRIGVATAKGIADGRNLPCIPVSSLSGNAWNVTLTDRLVCPVMDARRKQLYNALFEIRDGIPVRLTDDRLILLEDLKHQLISHKKSVLLLGDGAQMCYNTFIPSEELDIALAPSGLRYPAAYGAAMEATRLYREGKTIPASELMPLYLRQPQAVRERLAKEKQAHSE
ncbi:MAG: tRNA (adenosine(37)-N6)-threonylcarbamoyltransferase complex dimerization subunit type 1 TsaB [Eubacteriales bacterium]|nr:tRNA (adenosine(37)-N6)-threonylcarbamoyltransferase complex dimerization subunit type 1 TsaB [Eubacteriales bacterium]